jgi:hypothetical protein
MDGGATPGAGAGVRVLRSGLLAVSVKQRLVPNWLGFGR